MARMKICINFPFETSNLPLYIDLIINNIIHNITPNNVVLFPHKNDSKRINPLIIVLSKSNIPNTKSGANTAECQLNPDGYHTQLLTKLALSTKCNVSTNNI